MAVITQPLHIFRVIPESVEANARIRTSHDLGDKVHIYKRLNSSSWQCASYLAGKNRRTTTKGDSLSKAKEFAEGWYLQLGGKLRDGGLKSGMFPEAANLYLREFDIITHGQRSPTYARGQHARMNGPSDPILWEHGAS
jgi:hypothetical protein